MNAHAFATMPRAVGPACHPTIFMDYNGGAPLVPEARSAMLPFLEGCHGNPGSGHWASASASAAISKARKQVAGLIGAKADEIVFTSGATEANNHAIKGVWARARSGGHIITTAIEHEAVLRPVRFLRGKGATVTSIRPDISGRVDPERIRAAIRPDTVLISVMFANNETGVIQPIAEIGSLARDHGIAFHTDAAQAAGKVPIDLNALPVDLLSLAGHKFGAPNGVGALFVREDVKVAPLVHGAGHEAGRRAGTESAMLAAGLGAAARAACAKDHEKVRALRDRMWSGLQDAFGNRVMVNGDLNQTVPNTLSVSFPGRVGAEILSVMPEVAATTGSACHAGCVTMSHVLIAMGASMEVGLGTIRFSLGEANGTGDVDYVVGRLKELLA